MARERDRLVKELANQVDLHKAALQKAKDSEASLQAKFETQCSNWADMERALNDGYGRIEDMVDGDLTSSFLRLPTVIWSGFQLHISYFHLTQSTSLATLSSPAKPSKLTPKSGGRPV